MDRDKLKQSGNARRARGGAKAAAAATTVTSALGLRPQTVTLGGRQFRIAPLDFNDLIVIEDEQGNLSEFLARVGSMELKAIRYFFWLLLRKSAPELTLEEAGQLIPIQETEITVLLVQMLAAAGLVGDDSGNEAAPAVATSPSTGA